MNRNVVLLIGAVAVFILAISLDEYRAELMLAGLAAFAAAHLPI